MFISYNLPSDLFYVFGFTCCVQIVIISFALESYLTRHPSSLAVHLQHVKNGVISSIINIKGYEAVVKNFL